MLKNKNKYMAQYRLENNEMQSTARALRNQIVEQSRSVPPRLAPRPQTLPYPKAT